MISRIVSGLGCGATALSMQVIVGCLEKNCPSNHHGIQLVDVREEFECGMMAWRRAQLPTTRGHLE